MLGRFTSANDAIENLNLKYIITSGGRLLDGGDVNDYVRRNSKPPKFIQRGSTNQILRGYIMMNVNFICQNFKFQFLAKTTGYKIATKCNTHCDGD